MSDLITDHLDTSPKTLSPHQYGFRRNMSTEAALSRVTSELQRTSYSGEYTIAISFDIEAAFDSILYQAIINSSVNFQVPEYLINYIHSYLHEQTVMFKGATHRPQEGCPQGSVLGPLLWNIGYNPVLEVISQLAHVTCFTDDTMVIITASSILLLKEKFEKFCTIFTALLAIIAVKPNVSKTEILFLPGLRYHPELPVFTFQGQAIVSRHVIKYLGVYIDSKFTFLPHCKYLETKCLKIINALKVLFANKYGYSNKSRKQMLNGTAGAIIKYIHNLLAHTSKEK